MNLEQLLTAFRCNTYRSRSAPGALLFAAALLLPSCGKVAGGRVDSESHFLGCSSDADCGGSTCSAGVCVDGAAPVADPEQASVADVEQAPVADATPPSAFDQARCTVPIPEARINQQSQLDAFEGCENIYGDLKVNINADLRPLHALRNLYGSLTIGSLKDPQASLEGLDNLELVSGSLQLLRLGAMSLAPLARLRSIGTTPEDGLVLMGSDLRDLSGLENLQGLQFLQLYGLPQLVSIDALHLPGSMSSVQLEGLPALVSAHALSSVATLESLTLQRTGLAQLDVLSGTHVGRLQLDADFALDVAGVGAVDELSIQVNDGIHSLALPPQIAGLKKLEISNSMLETISGLAQLTHLDSLSVAGNQRLGSLSLPGLQSVTNVEVLGNDGLTALALPQLQGPVENLVVVSNSRLRSDSLASVTALARRAKIGANQGDPTRLAPCPFEQDGSCDAANSRNGPHDTNFEVLCAAGTDLVDCASSR